MKQKAKRGYVEEINQKAAEMGFSLKRKIYQLNSYFNGARRNTETTCCFWISELVKMFTGLSQSETKTLVVKAVKDLKTFGHIACKELEQWSRLLKLDQIKS